MIQLILSTIAAIGVIVSIFALIAGKNRAPSTFALALALTVLAALELFDLKAVTHPDAFLHWKKFSILAEGVLPFLFILYSATIARKEGPFSIPAWQKASLAVSLFLPVAASIWPVDRFFYSPDFMTEKVLFLENISSLFYMLFMALLVVALINLESLLVNASREVRWRLKFELIGGGALLAVLIFYYSHGLLYRSINMNLAPLRSIALIMAAGMLAYSRLWRGNGSRVYVSKQMAFRSVVLMAVGFYLIGLGLLGEGMRYFGDPFRHALIMGLVLAAGIGFLLVLFSETAKRKLRVFLHKNFYRQKYDYRIQWLQFTERLTSAKDGDDLLRAMVLGFCETFGMGCGALYLFEAEQGHYRNAAQLGMVHPLPELIQDNPLLKIIDRKEWVVNIPEEMPERPEKVAFLFRNSMMFAVPLMHNALLEGFVLLGRPLNANESYYYEDYDLMKTLACQASSAVLNLRLADELSRAREMEAAGRISAFVLHDLKNLVSTLALVMDNAREYINNPEFQQDMLQSLDVTVAKMKDLIARLKKIREKASLQRESADLLTLAYAAVGQLGASDVKLSGESVACEVDVEEIQKLLVNLLLNAVEATGGSGGVSVEVGFDGAPYVRVKDPGCGMSQEFIRTRLFKPFTTTKKKGLGIGLYQCRQIAEAHGGTIEVTSQVGTGSTFTVRLPKTAERCSLPA